MINWKEIPFVRFLLPFATGISLSVFLDNNHNLWYVSLVLLCLLRLILVFRKVPFQFRLIHGIVANILLFLIGYLWCFHYNELHKASHFEKHLEGENIIIGKIANSPEVGKYIKARFSVLQIGGIDDSLKNCSGTLLIYIKKDSISDLNYGDILAIRGRLQKVDEPKNPFAFNYQRYLYFQNIHYQIFANSSKNWKVLAKDQGSYIHNKTIQVRKYFLSVLEGHLKSPFELAVGKAIIIGQKDDLDEEVQTAYAHTGALHVLAVSGLHVGLVAWFVNMLLSIVKSRTWTWRILKMFILVLVIWAFALITGGSPSVLRASTMFTFLIIGFSINRATNIYNSLAISATFLLVWNPYLLFNVGFQLSYLAVIGSVFFQPKIYAAWIIRNNFAASIWKLVTVTFGAQIGTLPISIYYFHSLPLLAWLSGILVIPAATIILGSGLLLLITHSLIPTVAFIPGKILFWTIWGMNQAIFFIQKIPWCTWKGLWFGIGSVLLLYLFIGNVALVFSRKNYRWLLPAAGFLLMVIINFSFKKINEIHQKKITIYHSHKNSIIDFFDGKNAWSFSNRNISGSSLNYACQNNRWANGAKKVVQSHFEVDDFQNKNLLFQYPFLNFFDKKILIIDDEFQWKNHPKIKVDFVLFQKNPKIKLEDISNYFLFEKIIFDCSNSEWKVKKWKELCQKMNFEFHDIFQKGAFELDID